MASALQMSGQAAAVGAQIDGLRDDAYSHIRDLQGLNRSVTTYGSLYSSALAEATDISFASIEKAVSLIENITYETVPTRDLIGGNTSPDYGHVFLSTDLDTIEDKLLSIVASAGSDTVKDISAAFLSDTDIASMESAYLQFKASSLNRLTTILTTYPTADIASNIEWIGLRNAMGVSDFKKKLYVELFKVAQGTAEWAAKNVVNVEELHASFTASYNQFLSSMVDTNVATYKAEVSANIADFTNQIKKAGAEIDINKMKASEKEAELSLKVKQETSRESTYAKHYSSAMGNTLSSLEASIAASQSVAGSYKAILAAQSQRYSDIIIGRQ